MWEKWVRSKCGKGDFGLEKCDAFYQKGDAGPKSRHINAMILKSTFHIIVSSSEQPKRCAATFSSTTALNQSLLLQKPKGDFIKMIT